jgi:hypothetical protein
LRCVSSVISITFHEEQPTRLGCLLSGAITGSCLLQTSESAITTWRSALSKRMPFASLCSPPVTCQEKRWLRLLKLHFAGCKACAAGSIHRLSQPSHEQARPICDGIRRKETNRRITHCASTERPTQFPFSAGLENNSSPSHSLPIHRDWHYGTCFSLRFLCVLCFSAVNPLFSSSQPAAWRHGRLRREFRPASTYFHKCPQPT